jgi:hypothetical protein
MEHPLPGPMTAPQARAVAASSYRLCGKSSAIALSLLASSLISSCDRPKTRPVSLPLHQQWQLQPGHSIAGRPITSGLGDVLVELDGKAIYMPKSGLVQPLSPASSDAQATASDCIAIASPEIPAYRLRLCHLRRPRLGQQPAGSMIGRGEQVAISMLRKQPEGTWAFVEPSPSLLEALLTPP